MKARLMHRDRDFDLREELPWNAEDLTRDLELDTLLAAMAGGDPFLRDVARRALLGGFRNDLDTIRYRQEIARDCLANPGVVRELYALAVEAIERKQRGYFGLFSRFPASVLSGAVEAMRIFVDVLGHLRGVARRHAARFRSEGFRAFFAMLERELGEEYLAGIERHLGALRFRGGVLLGAGLGPGGEIAGWTLRQAQGKPPGWLARLLRRAPRGHTVVVAERDQAGARYLSEMRDRGINLVANALAQSADHILGFFEVLRTELGFHVACLNLHERLRTLAAPTCFPTPGPAAERGFRCTGLYDPSLALTAGRAPVGNDVAAPGKGLVVITGANHGGKSTFLRGVGLAQLMMQAGAFVGAGSLEAGLATALYTHHRREEDATMKSGKLDEELARLSAIADHLAPDALVLFNESFAATNEREGSEIARQVVSALLEKRIKILFVTHLYEFAHGLAAKGLAEALFLRAERRADGVRTFRLVEGEPLETSYGEDLFREVFAGEAEPAPRGEEGHRAARSVG